MHLKTFPMSNNSKIIKKPSLNVLSMEMMYSHAFPQVVVKA